MPRLILASTSPYRKALLARLRLPFEVAEPDFEELRGGIPPETLVRLNTMGKAVSVLRRHPEARIIASDQIAVHNGNIIGKPGNSRAAIAQLQRFSGRTVEFLTGIALCSDASEHFDIVSTRVCFRHLDDEEIETYVRLEQPLNCAGSFRSEGLGIALFKRIDGEDPTALIGLPLMRLSDWLRPLARAATL